MCTDGHDARESSSIFHLELSYPGVFCRSGMPETAASALFPSSTCLAIPLPGGVLRTVPRECDWERYAVLADGLVHVFRTHGFHL